MIINKFAFGNKFEAFIENRLDKKLNIIYSNENNRGKTLVLQGMMYCLGNDPIFPVGFESKKYHFYLNVTNNEKIFEIVRKKDTYLIKSESEDIFQICNSTSEFKYFFNQHIEKLPRILKDGQERVVDTSLFLETFFIGQDRRDTSNIFSKGFYNKSDFISMLYSMGAQESKSLDPDEIKNIQQAIAEKKQKIAFLTKELGRLKISPKIGSMFLSTNDREQYDLSKKTISGIYELLADLKKQRARELNRTTKLEHLIAELNSLNRSIEEGMVVCADCGSERIVYKSKELEFEISNSLVKKSIISSIEESIALRKEITADLTLKIEYNLQKITQELKQSPPNFRDFILFSEKSGDAAAIDNEIKENTIDLQKLINQIELGSTISREESERQSKILGTILERMNYYYKIIDPLGQQEFDSLFTKRGETYSGSEGQEFYFCKLMAIKDYMKHNFPLVIDSFREGEISSSKEEEMIRIFEKCQNQVIVTSTLKNEEYNTNKYQSSENKNVIDYSLHDDSKILNIINVAEFSKTLTSFNISLDDR